MLQSIFQIDNSRKAPKYLQIVHSVTKSLRSGKLKNGDRLLSINEMSSELQLARDTVQKAYQILEKDGILVPVRGKGYYISRLGQLEWRQPVSWNKVDHDYSPHLVAALAKEYPLLTKYKKMVLVCAKPPAYLKSLRPLLARFCQTTGLCFTSTDSIISARKISKYELFFVFEENDLVCLIRKTAQQFKPGVDIGIISFNDTPLKELLLGGITTISADHYTMGENRIAISGGKDKTSVSNPFSLIIRKSL